MKTASSKAIKAVAAKAMTMSTEERMSWWMRIQDRVEMGQRGAAVLYRLGAAVLDPEAE